MALSNSRQTLFEWYDKYVGEAVSKREVYGYWIFVLGYAIGVLGVLVYLLGSGGEDASFLIRETAIVLSAPGLALSLLGIVLQLPVRRGAVWAAVVSAGVAVASVVWFSSVYPQNWLGANSPQRTIIAVYILGVGVIAGVAVLVPVLTGERGYFLGRDFERDSDAIMVGEAERGGLFAVFRRGPADWRWRLLEQDAVANGVDGFASRPDVESTVDDVKAKVREAGMLEITHAAFRIYGDADSWEWVLMEEDGSGVATSAGEFPDRDAAEESVNVFKEYGPDATLLEVDDAAFDIERTGTDWTWRLLDDERTPLAVAPSSLDTEAVAEKSTDRVRETSGDADILAIQNLGFEVDESDGEWDWRLIDHTDTTIAHATTTDSSRDAVRDRIDDIRTATGSAPVTVETDPAFELTATTDSAWAWRLTDDTDEILATDHGDPVPATSATDTIDSFQASAADAGIVEGEEPAFELFETQAGWQWRLVDEDRTLIEAGTDTYDDTEATETAIEHTIEQTAVAELIEYEEAAFQLYEADSGDWRWRLIDEGGSVLTDSGEDYDTREAAASGMSVIKEHAPDADLLEIDSAAIELFRTDDGEWGWRLVDETGETLGEAGTRHPSKAAAKDDANRMRDITADATTRTIGGGAYQLYERKGDDRAPWRWRFIAATGDILADGTTHHTTRDGVERTVDSVRSAAPDADTHRIDPYSIAVITDGDGWGWELRDTDRTPLAESTQQYPDRGAAESVVDTVQTHVADATVFELRGPVYRLKERDDDAYEWALIDTEWNPIAAAPTTYDTQDSAETAIKRVRGRAPAAGVLEYENAAYEVYSTPDGWEWRLIDDDGDVRAVSATTYNSEDAASTGLDRVREMLGAASILEIETSSFELHEGDTGWRWRLVDRRGETVAESAKTYPSRTAAREGMQSLKEHAPDAGIVVAG